jgi:hypothetical protein
VQICPNRPVDWAPVSLIPALSRFTRKRPETTAPCDRCERSRKPAKISLDSVNANPVILNSCVAGKRGILVTCKSLVRRSSSTKSPLWPLYGARVFELHLRLISPGLLPRSSVHPGLKVEVSRTARSWPSRNYNDEGERNSGFHSSESPALFHRSRLCRRPSHRHRTAHERRRANDALHVVVRPYFGNIVRNSPLRIAGTADGNQLSGTTHSRAADSH